MTMEQSLADLVLRRIVTKEMALSRSSRPDQLEGLLERAGFEELQRGFAADAAGGGAMTMADETSIWKKEISSAQAQGPKADAARQSS